MQDRPRSLSGFAAYAWATLVFTVVVILWGAFVRATGSGAGCGEHWPLCNGVVLPRSPELATVIEFSHRLSSGLSVVLVGALTIWAYRRHPRGHAARQGATLALGFLLLEAVIGAGLVLLQLVAKNASALRALGVAVHLTNTFVLLACLTYVAWYATVGRAERFQPRASTARGGAVAAGLGLLVVVGVSGAIVALGDTLFPAATLAEGLAQDAAPTAHFLLRLRVVHPVLAVGAAGYVLGLVSYIRARDPRRLTAKLCSVLTAAVCVQVGLGTVNLALLAPVWLQLVHLANADVTWVTLVALGLTTLTVPDDEAVVAPAPAAPRAARRAFDGA